MMRARIQAFFQRKPAAAKAAGKPEMKILRDGETLSVSDIRELVAVNGKSFHLQLSAALPANVRHIDIDLSQTRMDCGGVGALVALRNWARQQNRDVAIRLLNPTHPVRRLFHLTRMDEVFPIERE
jgi:anti-anti-sigma factor